MRSSEEVRKSYQQFVDNFLSGEEGVYKKELMPNFWSVEQKEKDVIATIECRMRTKDERTWEEEWFAVVTQNGEKTNYLLEFDEAEIETDNILERFKRDVGKMPPPFLLNMYTQMSKKSVLKPEEKFQLTLMKVEIIKRMKAFKTK